MTNKGFSHIGLSTLDLDKTREFYEGVLGFEVVRCDIIKIKDGGQIRHMFFNIGRDQLIAFMEPSNIQNVPSDYDAGINRGLGVPGAFYHFAFEAGSVDLAMSDPRFVIRFRRPIALVGHPEKRIHHPECSHDLCGRRKQ